MAVDTTPRTRRAILAASLGSLGAFVVSAVSRVSPTRASSGDNLVIGATNSAGSSQTVLNSTASGATFTLKDTATGGTGIFGWSSAISGDGRALYGRADSPSGFGLQAKNLGAAGTGAAVQALGGNNLGLDASSSGSAVRAVSTGSYAVDAESSGGHAVYGFASSTSGGYDGGHFVTWAANGYGVFARATSGSGATRGVYGDSYSGTGYGVEGYNPYNVGVYGVSSTGTGVVGENLSSGDGIHGIAVNGWSGWFNGDTRVENDFQVGGNESVAGYLAVGGTKSFRIDHPAAPADKYLIHYCTESSEVLNLYSGTATLDESGVATVELPAWFEALNVDVRYQLTPIGAPAPGLHVSAELADSTFGIAGGQPGQRVSWQLTARRNDPWVRAHGAPVEIDKRGRERGTYLHPELYNQPTSKGTPPLHPIRRRPRADAPAR